jgi:hypothetical protein
LKQVVCQAGSRRARVCDTYGLHVYRACTRIVHLSPAVHKIAAKERSWSSTLAASEARTHAPVVTTEHVQTCIKSFMVWWTANLLAYLCSNECKRSLFRLAQVSPIWRMGAAEACATKQFLKARCVSPLTYLVYVRVGGNAVAVHHAHGGGLRRPREQYRAACFADAPCGAGVRATAALVNNKCCSAS